MGERSSDDPGIGTVVALWGGATPRWGPLEVLWHCRLPKSSEEHLWGRGEREDALPFLQLYGEGEVCDSPRSYLICYDQAGS